MGRYVVARALQAMLIVVLITLSVFVILRVTAGDPARIRAPLFARPDIIEAYRAEFGTDQPLTTQLGNFLSGAINGDLGTSFRFQRPVAAIIVQRLPNTLALSGLALLFSVATVLTLGIRAAARPRSVTDRFCTLLVAAGQSAPTFWVCLLLSLVFAVQLGIFPATGYEGVQSLILPATAVALGMLPTQLRVLRAAMGIVLRDDYIRTARAFGLPEWRINFIYGLRNGCLPLLTVIGVDLGYLLAGVIVAEVVFNFPGVGSLALTALNSRDFPLIQGITIVTASVFVVLNLVIDLLYAVIDPRIRLRER
jgi:ABC-type dipeptide/oligopeptide/nickel transport system permease component